ncbi:MAG TPA: hypothetical protein VIZ32_03330, partial [Vicinamibacterales bacterium]
LHLLVPGARTALLRLRPTVDEHAHPASPSQVLFLANDLLANHASFDTKGRDEVRAGAVPHHVVNVRRSPRKRPYEAVHLRSGLLSRSSPARSPEAQGEPELVVVHDFPGAADSVMASVIDSVATIGPWIDSDIPPPPLADDLWLVGSPPPARCASHLSRIKSADCSCNDGEH